MRIVLSILLMSFVAIGNTQTNSLVGKVRIVSSFIPKNAKWNMSGSANVQSGYNNLVQTGFGNIGDLAVTDATTGWTLKTTGSQWEGFTGGFTALTNGDGGCSGGGCSYGAYPQAVLNGGFINAGHTSAEFGGTSYPFYIDNLTTGTYTLTVVGSIKASVKASTPNGYWQLKVGSGGSPQNLFIAEQSNYTQPGLTFTFSITTGQTLYFGPYTLTTSSEDAALANVIDLTQTSN